MTKQPKVIICVVGGVVQDIFTDSDIEVVVFDWDDIEQTDDPTYLEALKEGEIPTFPTTVLVEEELHECTSRLVQDAINIVYNNLEDQNDIEE